MRGNFVFSGEKREGILGLKANLCTTKEIKSFLYIYAAELCAEFPSSGDVYTSVSCWDKVGKWRSLERTVEHTFATQL